MHGQTDAWTDRWTSFSHLTISLVELRIAAMQPNDHIDKQYNQQYIFYFYHIPDESDKIMESGQYFNS